MAEARRSVWPVRRLLVVGLWWLAAAPTAFAAPVAISGSESSRALRYLGPAVTATLTLRTQAVAQTVAVGLQPSVWQDRLMVGSPLRTFDRQISGSGRVTGAYAASGGASLPGASACVRGGSESTGSGIDLSLPARSTTRIFVAGRARRAPVGA